MFENQSEIHSKQYNEPNSLVFQDAHTLENIARQKVTELCQKKRVPMTPEKVGLKQEAMQKPPSWSDSTKTKFDFILNRIHKQEDGMGRNLAHIFRVLPQKSEYPDYYKIIKRPMDLERVTNRVSQGGYETIEEFFEELLLVFENATVYNEPGSIIYQDALILHKVAIDSLHLVENGNPQDPNPNFKIEDPQSFLQKILRDLQNHVSKNPKTKIMEEKLGDFIPAERNRPRKFGDIEVWLEQKRYKRLDVYQGHVFSLFEAVRERSQPNDEVFKISIELHKKFILRRGELTKNGEKFCSPACTYTDRDIQDSIEDLKKRREEGNFSPSQGENWDVDTVTSQNGMSIPFDVETEDLEVEHPVAIPQMEPGSQQYSQV